MKKEVMKALFKQKPRTPVELVRHARELLIYAQSSTETREHKREEKLSDLSKTILEIRTVLYGHEGSEPSKDACANLTREFFKEDTFRLLIIALPNLNLGARQNATHVIANLQRQRVDEQLIASLYLENNMDLMDTLICGYEDNDIALTYGAIARECIRHQRVARYVLGSDLIKKFFGYVQIPNFDIQSDAAATFKELLTRHKSTVADFLDKNYDWFFQEYNSLLLESNCYLTKRIAVQLLGDMLLDRSNTAVMIRYVSSLDNMRIFMNLLRDSNKSIQFATFQVFKLFVANEHKPPEIVSIIISNRNKLLRFFADFNSDKEDDLFQEDRQEVIRLIAALELKDTPATSLDKCEVPC